MSPTSICFDTGNIAQHNNVLRLIVLQSGTDPIPLNGPSCTCAAGEVLCSHRVALLFQSAHDSMMQVKALPSAVACTSTLQTWHRPRTKGICAEPVQDLVVRKPKPSIKTLCKSTLYQTHTGALPDPSLFALGGKTKTSQTSTSAILSVA
ncbi:uncharacterized protein KZ484_010540 [Pholidichthys leucotaenia]